MNRLIRLFRTSIGRKLVVAVTGALLIGFLITHLLGNLTLFQGPEVMNAYAAWLQGHPLIWVARAGLLLIFGVHLVTAIQLSLENRRARPVRYRRHDTLEAGFDSRYILITGLTVLAFVVYHLLHFTFRVIDADHYHLVDAEGRHDVYAMVIGGFRNPWIAGSYIVAMVILGVHLIHGARSMFQTLGINHESYNGIIHTGVVALVAALVLGNVALPTVVYTGVVEAKEAPIVEGGTEPGVASLPVHPDRALERSREGGS